MAEDLTRCYVALRPCGCAVGFVVDAPGMAIICRRDTQRWLKAGYTVKAMTVEESRSLFRKCTHQPETKVFVQEALW